MIVNKSKSNEVSLRLVLESEPAGREYFDQHKTLDELFQAHRELTKEALKATKKDCRQRLVLIAIVPKADYGEDADYGYGLGATKVPPDDEGERQYLNKYVCPDCGHKWHEVWTCGCDSECPKCDTRNISPV